MPIYEYACGRCKKRSSALLSRYDSPDPACPHCGSRRVRRLVSSFATTRPQDGGEDLGGAGGGGDFG
ncbi:MAG: FmdB family zinc ribbon protein, partial [Candidatus Dormibacterales bacterium]